MGTFVARLKMTRFAREADASSRKMPAARRKRRNSSARKSKNHRRLAIASDRAKQSSLRRTANKNLRSVMARLSGTKYKVGRPRKVLKPLCDCNLALFKNS